MQRPAFEGIPYVHVDHSPRYPASEIRLLLAFHIGSTLESLNLFEPVWARLLINSVNEHGAKINLVCT